MKILVITHDKHPYYKQKKKMRWTRLPYHFQKLGHTVRYVTKKEWLLYPFIFLKFNPDIIISAGKIAGVITGVHHKICLMRRLLGRPVYVNDLTDHPHFYKSDERIEFIVANHDYATTPTRYNLVNYNCDYLIANGSDFTPKKAKIEYDACYIGQVHGFYQVDKLVRECEKEGIKLNVVHGLPSEKVPNEIAKSKICVYTISWDSSLKMTDYAAMAKPVVAVKPNLAEKIGYPALYTKDLVEGIKHLLDNPEKAKKLGQKSREWFQEFTGSWETQAKKYLNLVQELLEGKRVFTMDVEKDVDAAADFASLLHKHGLIGEFYVLGKLVEQYPGKIKKIQEMGHILGGHGYDHEKYGGISYVEAEEMIDKTVKAFKDNDIKIKGWRFPGFSFRNNQMKILRKHKLFDSSIQDKPYQRYGKFIGIRNFISNLKRKNFVLPTLMPQIKELAWSFVDLNDKKFYKHKGRLVTHCFAYKRYKKELKEYLEQA